MKKRTVVRLMNGLEKRSDDCYAHALWLGEVDGLAKVLTDDGVVHYWPPSAVVDDATDDEISDFYIDLNKTRSRQRAEYKEEVA